MYTIKYHFDGTIERLKACLVANGFIQTFGLGYLEIFSPVARLNSTRVLISLDVSYNWPLFQLDVKNAFLNGELQEEVYMAQPFVYVAQGESGKV